MPGILKDDDEPSDSMPANLLVALWLRDRRLHGEAADPPKRAGPPRRPLGAIFETLRGSRRPKEAYSDIAVGLRRKYYSIKRMIARERARWRREHGGILGP
jgi:hypothetical protein